MVVKFWSRRSLCFCRIHGCSNENDGIMEVYHVVVGLIWKHCTCTGYMLIYEFIDVGWLILPFLDLLCQWVDVLVNNGNGTIN